MHSNKSLHQVDLCFYDDKQEWIAGEKFATQEILLVC